MELALNLLIAALTAAILIRFARKKVLQKALRYFTVLSNLLCAVSAVLICLAPDALWAWTLKFVGTAAVTVTMLTVLFFLGPAYGYKALLSGSDLIMHLVTPLLALASFLVFERRQESLLLAFLGLLPVALYGVLYGYKILAAPPEKAWEDFYGFNKGGRWGLSVLAMAAATLLISFGLLALQRL